MPSRISPSAMSEIETALKDYSSAVQDSDLKLGSQAMYVDLANNFVRWLRFDFESGSQMAHYAAKKKKDTARANVG